jgi:hypothetical protein
MKFDRMQGYTGSARADENLECLDGPVILVQRENTPSEERSVLQSLGFDVLLGGSGIQSNVVPVIAVSEADLTSKDVRERIVALARHWPEAPMFCVSQTSSYPNPASWVDADDTTERLVESGLGYFFDLDHENVARCL